MLLPPQPLPGPDSYPRPPPPCVSSPPRPYPLHLLPFQGLTATLVRNTPANAMYLGNFEMMKQAYCRTYNCAPSEVPGHIVLGAAGKPPEESVELCVCEVVWTVPALG